MRAYKRAYISAAKGFQLWTLLNQLPLTDLQQYLFKSETVLSSDLGTKAIDNLPIPIDADIYQSCLYPTAGYQFPFTSPVVIDWTTDGVKAEFIVSLKVGQSVSNLIMKSTANHGIRLYDSELRIYGYKADGISINDVSFTNITTVADNSYSRYRISKSGVNIVVEKTIPSDFDFTDSNKISQTINATTFDLGNQTFDYIASNGGMCYLNVSGNKFAFGEGRLSRFLYSYTSDLKISLQGLLTELVSMQNVYCHNAVYGYTRAYAEADTRKEYVNIAYQEDGTPATSFHSAFFTQSAFEEFPANKSFGYGYGIKLNSALLPYDQENTFFDVSDVAKLVYKQNVPSKLNKRVFFNHKYNKDLVIYSADKNISLPINTASKKAIIVGDSIASDDYLWGVIFAQLTGMITTVKSFSGRTLSTQIEGDLDAQVSGDPTLVSDKDFIIICGGFNDYATNINEATFTSGLTSLLAYNRAQNPTAKIIVCAPYNWGNPIDSGNTENSGGMSRNEQRSIMQSVLNTYANSVFINWNDANIIQAEISNNLHLSSIAAAYRIGKLMYDKLLTVFT